MLLDNIAYLGADHHAAWVEMMIRDTSGAAPLPWR